MVDDLFYNASSCINRGGASITLGRQIYPNIFSVGRGRKKLYFARDSNAKTKIEVRASIDVEARIGKIMSIKENKQRVRH